MFNFFPTVLKIQIDIDKIKETAYLLGSVPSCHNCGFTVLKLTKHNNLRKIN